MKQRSLAAIVILSFVTLGIYNLFWLYDTRRELVARRQAVPSFILIGLPYSVFVASFVLMFFAAVADILNSVGGPTDSNDTVFLLVAVMLFSGLATVAIGAVWTYKYLKAGQAVTNGRLDPAVTYILGVILLLFGIWFVWPAIVQSTFNKYGNAPTSEPPFLPSAPANPIT